MPGIGPIPELPSDRYETASTDSDPHRGSSGPPNRATVTSRPARGRGPRRRDVLAILFACAAHLFLSLLVIPHYGESSNAELIYYSFYNVFIGSSVGFYLLDRIPISGFLQFLLRSSSLILTGTLINESVVEPVFFGDGPINGEGIYYGLTGALWTSGIFLLIRLAEWQYLLGKRMHSGLEPGPLSRPVATAPACFFVRVAGETRRLHAPDILYLEADRDFTRVVCTNGDHFVSESLKSLEDRSAGFGVFRVHKSFAVNLGRVERMTGSDVHLGEVRIPVGRRYRSALAEAWGLPAVAAPPAPDGE